MTQEELNALQVKVGADAAAAIKKELDAYEVKMKAFATEVAKQNGGISEAQFTEYKKAAEAAIESVKSIAEKQGTTLAEVALKLGNASEGKKSIAQTLKDDEEALRKVYDNGVGTKTYMVQFNAQGQPVMKAIEMTSKTAGTIGTIDGIGGGVSSITQSLDAATLLRVGAGAMINNQYRNTSWVFDLVNTISADFNATPFVMWFDEQAKDGASATTTEGATKPATQYKYQLKSSTYKKEATLIGMTQEFQMDFGQLESNILNVGRIDVINRVNQAILPDIIANATAYNANGEAAAFKGTDGIANVNEFDVIAAMAAQVENATFGAKANAAVMGTNKKYRMGIIKNTQGSYLNPPDVLAGIGFVGNPTMGADAILVGDLKQYNVILRGGLIVKVGYNGNDFGNNAFSIVMEQYYFNYISTIRKVAIVSGPDFATVKALITA